MKHPNILSIEGVVRSLFEFGMVSQWMDNGDMLSYAIRYPGVNRLGLVGPKVIISLILRSLKCS